MTTSSSDTNRCTRISPSAVLDDRLDGKDLEWARDHLRRCEACRERVEEFREMLLRVGRLPRATVVPSALDAAFGVAIPENLRTQSPTTSFDIAQETDRPAPPSELPSPLRPEVVNARDLMSELEREIFRDEPVQDHPTPLAPPAISGNGAIATPSIDEESPAADPAEPIEEAARYESEEDPASWREVPIDSHREPGMHEPAVDESTQDSISEGEPTDWSRLLERIAAAPEPVAPAAASMEVPEDDGKLPLAPMSSAIAEPPAATSNVIYDQEPALTFEAEPEATPAPPRQKSDRAMRLAVGLGAAACVLLAAVLYEGGYFLKTRSLGTATATTRVSARPSTSTHAVTSPSLTPSASQPPATVLYTLGNGVAGNTVFRIRPGTAVPGYTRLVFDMHGGGLPSMIITRPDDSHVQVIFKNTTMGSVAVNGIRSFHVSAVEPGVQQGSDASFIIDLARAVRVTAFTLPATGSYAWRLVVDLHTS